MEKMLLLPAGRYQRKYILAAGRIDKKDGTREFIFNAEQTLLNRATTTEGTATAALGRNEMEATQ